MIGEDLDIFDPREHPWIQLDFGRGVERQCPRRSHELRDTLAKPSLADALYTTLLETHSRRHSD